MIEGIPLYILWLYHLMLLLNEHRAADFMPTENRGVCKNDAFVLVL